MMENQEKVNRRAEINEQKTAGFIDFSWPRA